MESINWPKKYTPGMTDNFVSNEIVVADLNAAAVWECIIDTTMWPSYYSKAADIAFRDGDGPKLREGSRFFFLTMGYLVEAVVEEFVPPQRGQAARLAWSGLIGDSDDAASLLDVYHAWLFEDLSGERVRIVTQESQIGQPARDMAIAVPNPMLNAHQEWITGLARTAAHRQPAQV